MWPKSSLLGAFPSAAFQRCGSAKACLLLLVQRLVLDPRVKNFITPVYLFLKISGGVGGFGKCSDRRSTIMGWLHHRTMDDFKIIDILNEITCKHVEDIKATLMEFVKEGMVVEVEPNLYMIQRNLQKHLPQPINDFIIEDLKYEGRKENKSIRYNYKVVEGIALEGSFTFCGQCAASGDFLLYGW